jgi:hypothetical protein
MDNVVKFKIDGSEYALSFDELTLGEVELLEKETGRGIGALDMESMTSVMVLAWLARRRTQPHVTLDEMRALPITAIEVVEDPTQDGVDETATPEGTGTQS